VGQVNFAPPIKSQNRKVVAMKKRIRTEINVRTIFDGKRDRSQVFADLIIHKAANHAQNQKLETAVSARYNKDKVFSDVRVAKKEEIA
jgi:hypothetical protein